MTIELLERPIEEQTLHRPILSATDEVALLIALESGTSPDIATRSGVLTAIHHGHNIARARARTIGAQFLRQDGYVRIDDDAPLI